MLVYELIRMLKKTDPQMTVEIYDEDAGEYMPVTGLLSDTRDMSVWLFSDEDDDDLDLELEVDDDVELDDNQEELFDDG